MEENNITLISKHPEKVLYKIPFPNKWVMELIISKDNTDYKWEKLAHGYNNLPKEYKKNIDTQLDKAIELIQKDVKKAKILKPDLTNKPNLKLPT